jgi:hypothetical protein
VRKHGSSKTLAERMYCRTWCPRIKFGAAPIPAAISRPPALLHPIHHPQADTEHVEPSEGEEERARKERIAAKLSGMR